MGNSYDEDKPAHFIFTSTIAIVFSPCPIRLSYTIEIEHRKNNAHPTQIGSHQKWRWSGTLSNKGEISRFQTIVLPPGDGDTTHGSMIPIESDHYIKTGIVTPGGYQRSRQVWADPCNLLHLRLSTIKSARTIRQPWRAVEQPTRRKEKCQTRRTRPCK